MANCANLAGVRAFIMRTLVGAIAEYLKCPFYREIGIDMANFNSDGVVHTLCRGSGLYILLLDWRTAELFECI
jgi:hypothetical protein